MIAHIIAKLFNGREKQSFNNNEINIARFAMRVHNYRLTDLSCLPLSTITVILLQLLTICIYIYIYKRVERQCSEYGASCMHNAHVVVSIINQYSPCRRIF